MSNSRKQCFAHRHLTMEQYGLYTHVREVSHQSGRFILSARKTAEHFADTSRSRLNRVAASLVKAGWLVELKAPSRDRHGVWRPGEYRARSHEEWAELQPGTCPTGETGEPVPDSNPVTPAGQACLTGEPTCPTGETGPVPESSQDLSHGWTNLSHGRDNKSIESNSVRTEVEKSEKENSKSKEKSKQPPPPAAPVSSNSKPKAENRLESRSAGTPENGSVSRQAVLGLVNKVLRRRRLPAAVSRDQQEMILELAGIGGLKVLEIALTFHLARNRPQKENFVLDEFLSGPGAALVEELRMYYENGARHDSSLYLAARNRELLEPSQMSPELDDLIEKLEEEESIDIDPVVKEIRDACMDGSPEEFLRLFREAAERAIARERAEEEQKAKEPLPTPAAPEPAKAQTTDAWGDFEVEPVGAN
jgi:hypothetical protein